ncbi:MAG: hypothetical protein AAFP88_02515 [Bacteroidota bacterium]
MSILSKRLESKPPIPGFHVMEWLRGVRDTNYKLSIKDPEARRRQKQEARKRLEEKAQKTGRKIIEP